MNHKLLLSASVVVSSLGLLAGSQARADSFEFHTRVPATANGASCVDEAASVGQKFLGATGAAVVSTACTDTVTFQADGKTQTVFDVGITYTAKQELVPYTALLGSVFDTTTPANTAGAYSSYADCLADLDSQSNLFIKNTSLAVVAASCQPGTAMLNPSFVLKMEGFGKAKNRLFTLPLDLLVTLEPSFVERGSQLLASLGGVVVKNTNSVMFYYAPNVLPVHQESLEIFGSAESCSSQLGQAESIYKNLGDSAIFVTCAKLGSDTPDVALEAMRIGSGLAMQELGFMSDNYLSLQECMNSRDAVLQKAKLNNPNLLGALCHELVGTTLFNVDLFSRL